MMDVNVRPRIKLNRITDDEKISPTMPTSRQQESKSGGGGDLRQSLRRQKTTSFCVKKGEMSYGKLHVEENDDDGDASPTTSITSDGSCSTMKRRRKKKNMPPRIESEIQADLRRGLRRQETTSFCVKKGQRSYGKLHTKAAPFVDPDEDTVTASNLSPKPNKKGRRQLISGGRSALKMMVPSAAAMDDSLQDSMKDVHQVSASTVSALNDSQELKDRLVSSARSLKLQF